MHLRAGGNLYYIVLEGLVYKEVRHDCTCFWQNDLQINRLSS